MKNLDGIDVFVKVVQSGSFSAAARNLKMPLTTVSGKVASLERRLGTTLLHRTTRRLAITQEGSAYFEHCVRALEEIGAGEQKLLAQRMEPAGILHLSAPTEIVHAYLAPIIVAYLKTYAEVRVDLKLTDRLVDPVDEGCDLAVRVGGQGNSSLIMRKFQDIEAVLWARRGYAARHGMPVHPKDLRRHSVIGHRLSPTSYQLSNGRETIRATFQPRLVVDDLETAKTFVLADDYIALFPPFVCESEAASGEIVRVLDGWRYEFKNGPGQIYFVYPSQCCLPPKVRKFIDLAIKA
jgi:DNA-binding transcriptional LysR family regulator